VQTAPDFDAAQAIIERQPPRRSRRVTGQLASFAIAFGNVPAPSGTQAFLKELTSGVVARAERNRSTGRNPSGQVESLLSHSPAMRNAPISAHFAVRHHQKRH
jgi:hypothetical protein